MIVHAPDPPPIQPTNTVVLLGHGPWQARAAQELDRWVSVVVRTDQVQDWPAWDIYAERATRVVAWCGAGLDLFYLHDWIVFGYLVGLHPTKLLVGIGPGVDHPMADWLAAMAETSQLERFTDLAPMLTRCRHLIRGG